MTMPDDLLFAPLVEACVTSLREAREAEQEGARRLELCVELEVGGLTPPRGLLAAVVDAVQIPVCAMVRDRAGDFCYTPREVDEMVASASRLAAEGAAGLVWGGLGPDGLPDADQLRRILEAAGSLPLTFHKAFDEVPVSWQPDAAASLADLGVARILTAGGPGRAIDNVDQLKTLVDTTADRLTVLAGGSLRGDHVCDLLARTGCREIHARCAGVAGIVEALGSACR
jgi:copper homeostasis protein